MSSYYAIPRDLYTTLKSKHKPKVFANAILVLNELAFRIRYNGNLHDSLEIGQCFIGRSELSKALSISEQEVRTALTALEELTAIQPEINRKGTKLTILDKRIFSYVPTKHQPQSNQQVTTNIPEPITITRERGKRTPPPLNLLEFKNHYNKIFTTELMEREYPICDAWWLENKGRSVSTAGFLTWLNKAKKWDDEKKPKVDERYEEIKRKLFAPHPNKNWE